MNADSVNSFDKYTDGGEVKNPVFLSPGLQVCERKGSANPYLGSNLVSLSRTYLDQWPGLSGHAVRCHVGFCNAYLLAAN